MKTDQHRRNGKDELHGVFVHGLKSVYADFICNTATFLKHNSLV
jgi:hypothetical protein